MLFQCDQCEDEIEAEDQIILLVGRWHETFIPFYVCDRCAGEMFSGVSKRVEGILDRKAREGEWRDD